MSAWNHSTEFVRREKWSVNRPAHSSEIGKAFTAADQALKAEGLENRCDIMVDSDDETVFVYYDRMMTEAEIEKEYGD